MTHFIDPSTVDMLRISRRHLLTGGAALACAGLAGRSAWAADAWPSKPVRFVVPFAPGGSSEIVARSTAAELSKTLGQNVFVENKPGAAGNIAMQEVARSDDQHTVILGHIGTLAVNPYIFDKLPYDPNKDFTPVTPLASSPLVLVVPANSPMNSLNDVIQQAKSRQNGLTFASQGVGSIGHLLGEMFRTKVGGNFSHVAYKGSAPALQDVMGGQVDFMFDPVITTAPLIAGKRLKPIAIAADKRSPQMPNVPTVAELGVNGVNAGVWFGAVVKTGTPTAIVQRLNQAFATALKDPDVLKRFNEQGMQSFSSTPEEFGKYMQSEQMRWSALVKASGASID